jgi:hypothetical protein
MSSQETGTARRRRGAGHRDVHHDRGYQHEAMYSPAPLTGACKELVLWQTMWKELTPAE